MTDKSRTKFLPYGNICLPLSSLSPTRSLVTTELSESPCSFDVAHTHCPRLSRGRPMFRISILDCVVSPANRRRCIPNKRLSLDLRRVLPPRGDEAEDEGVEPPRPFGRQPLSRRSHYHSVNLPLYPHTLVLWTESYAAVHADVLPRKGGRRYPRTKGSRVMTPSRHRYRPQCGI